MSYNIKVIPTAMEDLKKLTFRVFNKNKQAPAQSTPPQTANRKMVPDGDK